MEKSKKSYSLIEGIGSSENMIGITHRGKVVKEFWLDAMTMEENVKFARLAELEQKNKDTERRAQAFYVHILNERVVDEVPITMEWLKKHISRSGLLRIMISLSDGALQMPDGAAEEDDTANPS